MRRLIVLFLLTVSCARPEVRHPNVLLITLDTFRADRITAATPNLLRLAGSGIWFKQADSAAPLTLPSHATILSGLLPPHHGLRNNGVGSFPSSRETLATIFSRDGYRTAAFVSSFVLDRRFGLARGFETYDDAIARDPNDTATTFEAERRGSETVDRALAWLNRGDARPWFAWVHLYDAHAPYAPPPPFPQTYDGEVAYVDAQVGRLLAAIEGQKTLIVVVGDHGEALGEHGELTHGLLIYESTLHVPLIVTGPKVAAREVQVAVSAADVAPTIVALAGLPLLHTDGRDISGGLKPASTYAESEYAKSFGWTGLTAMRSGNTKLIRGVTSEMFDLSRDPRESSNIINDQRRLYSEISRRLDEIGRSSIAPNGGVVDEETRSKLASLGYVAPGVSRPNERDPREVAPLFRRFEEATWAINSGQLRDGTATLETLVHEDPANPVFRSSLARAYRQSGDRERAIALYRQAVALSPADPDAWYNLAAALQEGGHTGEGGIAIREAIRRDTRRPEAHNVLGIAYAAEGNLKAAEEEFRTSLRLDPRNARAYNNLGNILRDMNRFDEAREAFRRSSGLAPSYADPLNGLGVLDVQQDRPGQAIASFDAALRITPNYYEAQLNRGIALKMAGDSEAATAQFRHLLAVLPERPEFDAQRKAARALLGR